MPLPFGAGSMSMPSLIADRWANESEGMIGRGVGWLFLLLVLSLAVNASTIVLLLCCRHMITISSIHNCSRRHRRDFTAVCMRNVVADFIIVTVTGAGEQPPLLTFRHHQHRLLRP
mmetsp:Transcript_16949/g.30772  ORF Transcript_16949/g.30772 Transcript_16949/m.30772 type:complete len:116 (+) Transcript_16949:792-1139(+)